MSAWIFAQKCKFIKLIFGKCPWGFWPDPLRVFLGNPWMSKWFVEVPLPSTPIHSPHKLVFRVFLTNLLPLAACVVCGSRLTVNTNSLSAYIPSIFPAVGIALKVNRISSPRLKSKTLKPTRKDNWNWEKVYQYCKGILRVFYYLVLNDLYLQFEPCQ